MRFEQIVEELYERYAKVVEKEEKIEKVREKARELGFENVEVEFNEKTETARAVIELDETKLNEECNRKLCEMTEWLVGKDYRVYSVKLLVTTENKEDSTLKGHIQDRAQQIGIKHATATQHDDDAYADYFELERDESGVFVYLLVYNEYFE